MVTILLEIILVMIWTLSFGKTFYDFEIVFDKFKITHVVGGLSEGKTLYDATLENQSCVNHSARYEARDDLAPC